MKTRYIFILLLSILQIPQLALALDFSKPSASVSGAAAQDAFMQKITKEQLFDMICEQAEEIKKTNPAKARGKLVRLGLPEVSARLLEEKGIQTLVGAYDYAFYNSYGNEIKKNKDCAEVPDHIYRGINRLINYYNNQGPDAKDQAIRVVESARKLPKACSTPLVDYLTYADKRFEQCISIK